MKNKLTHNKIRIFGLILFFAIPYLLVNIGNLVGYEGIARLLSLFIIFGLLPVLLLIFALHSKFKKYSTIKANGEERSWLIRSVLAAMSIFMLYFLTIPLLIDVVNFFNGGIVVNQGKITRLHSSAYDFIFHSQSIRLNDLEDDYNLIYGTKWLHVGETVEIKYLPKTKRILEATILEK